jgi:hypothetical protein
LPEQGGARPVHTEGLIRRACAAFKAFRDGLVARMDIEAEG